MVKCGCTLPLAAASSHGPPDHAPPFRLHSRHRRVRARRRPRPRGVRALPRQGGGRFLHPLLAVGRLLHRDDGGQGVRGGRVHRRVDADRRRRRGGGCGRLRVRLDEHLSLPRHAEALVAELRRRRRLRLLQLLLPQVPSVRAARTSHASAHAALCLRDGLRVDRPPPLPRHAQEVLADLYMRVATDDGTDCFNACCPKSPPSPPAPPPPPAPAPPPSIAVSLLALIQAVFRDLPGLLEALGVGSAAEAVALVTQSCS
mmetsp:Transcript_39681/g.131334  ORF Transcript_39681/g.131334 Transcript_39681/m.131334 type:complete len:258 (-) Transcript_39681:340-1113(-)